MRVKLEVEEKNNAGPMCDFLSQQYGKDPSESFLPGYCSIDSILFGYLSAKIIWYAPSIKTSDLLVWQTFFSATKDSLYSWDK